MLETKNWLVLSDGYHGHLDDCISLTPPSLGIPDRDWMAKLPDDYTDELLLQADAVIIEPIKTDISPSRIEWLKKLRDDCTRLDVVLIFDEIITGFRFPRFSVSNYYGIQPDLICLGKAIGNGMPLAVVAGKKHIMNCGEYFVSSTFAGETLSLAAALKTMTLLETKYDLSRLWDKGMQFLNRFNALMPGVLGIQGYPTRGVFVGDQLTKALFWQEACRAGILFGPSWFFNFKHIDCMDEVLSTCQDIAVRLKTGSVKLEGELPISPFSAKVRQQ